MPRLTLEQELQRLQDEVLTLGDMVGDALVESVRLLKERDLEGSKAPHRGGPNHQRKALRH